MRKGQLFAFRVVNYRLPSVSYLLFFLKIGLAPGDKLLAGIALEKGQAVVFPCVPGSES